MYKASSEIKVAKLWIRIQYSYIEDWLLNHYTHLAHW